MSPQLQFKFRLLGLAFCFLAGLQLAVAVLYIIRNQSLWFVVIQMSISTIVFIIGMFIQSIARRL